MPQLIAVIIILPFLVFWLWMFGDMTNNDYIPGDSKYRWTLAFILLSVVAAFYYYYVEYRPRRL